MLEATVAEYLRVAVLRLLVVKQSNDLPRGVEADVDLQTRVTGALPALCSTAVRTVHIPHDGAVHDSAARLVRPDTVQKNTVEHKHDVIAGKRPFLFSELSVSVATCRSRSAGW